ncbi:MAG: YHS domain-containing protein [Armatimonadetes bacterium]|nr:YHS domain-containing protein [Armatimonadota bacterium]
MLFVCLLGGCGPKKAVEAPESSPATSATPPPAAPTTGAALGSIKVGDKAVCAVCAAEGGAHGEEEVKATLDYKGKTYGFCSESEKAEFISNPSKYVGGGK